MNLVIAPHKPCFLEVAALCRVDADQTSEALTMLRILSNGDVDLFLVQHRRCDNFRWSIKRCVLERLACFVFTVSGWVAVKPPQLIHDLEITLEGCFRVQTVAEAITAAEDDHIFATHLAACGT